MGMINDKTIIFFMLLCTFSTAIADEITMASIHKDALRYYMPTLSASFKQALKTADVTEGEEFFMRKCSSCHDEYQSDTHGKGA
jgi:cytochrome c2